MVVRDFVGNEISESDVVSLALALGNYALGNVDKITTGIDGAPPMVFINFVIPIPIHQNGMVPGVQFVQKQQKTEDNKVLIN